MWDGGYDVVNDLDGVLKEFDKVIGLEAFRRIVNHPKLKDVPFYLETPCDLQGYKEEIALLKGLRK